MKKFCAYAEDVMKTVKPYTEAAGDYVQSSAAVSYTHLDVYKRQSIT